MHTRRKSFLSIGYELLTLQLSRLVLGLLNIQLSIPKLFLPHLVVHSKKDKIEYVKLHLKVILTKCCLYSCPLRTRKKYQFVHFVFSKEVLQDGRMKIQFIHRSRRGSYWCQKPTPPYAETLRALPTLLYLIPYLRVSVLAFASAQNTLPSLRITVHLRG